MPKYFVKKRYEATELITVAVGRIQDYYFGSKGPNVSICRDRLPLSYESDMWGLGSYQEAETLLASMTRKAEEETALGYWVASLSVVEVN